MVEFEVENIIRKMLRVVYGLDDDHLKLASKSIKRVLLNSQRCVLNVSIISPSTFLILRLVLNMQKKIKMNSLLGSVALSAIFTIALLYSTLELPHIMNKTLIGFFPDYGHHWQEAEQFINSIRPFGYACFTATLALIVLGFTLKKSLLSALGSLTLYLPTFGYFASTMFFLAGIGVLRILWLPVLELAPGPWPQKPHSITYILELGDSVYIPYDVVRCIMTGLAGCTPHERIFDQVLFYALIYSGSIIFFLGCVAWFYGKFKGIRLVDFWIYRYSRHPQYLGFLIWSYGLLIYDRFIFMPVKGGYFPSPPLFWLVATLILLGTTLREEAGLLRRYGEMYAKYRERTPFMLPLPNPIPKLITAPMRLIFGKPYPEKNREVALALAIYGSILILISIPYSASLS